MNERGPTIVIIGGGFSGTTLAANLLRLGTPVRVVLLNRFGPMGRGVAYGTGLETHLLNVPAGQMSAFPDDADHFLRYAQERDRERLLTADSFVSRRFYGEYLGHVLREAARTAAPGATLETIVGEGATLDPFEDGSGIDVVLANPHGPLRCVRADRVVLALGNSSPADPAIGDGRFYQSARYVRDPWIRGALDVVRPHDRVLLIGTGLTMMDIALDLSHRRVGMPLFAVSRHGLLPQAGALEQKPPSWAGWDDWCASASAPSSAWPTLAVPALSKGPATIAAYLRSVRARIAVQVALGGDWRDVIGSLRGITPSLWQARPHAERARFLRHVRPYWDVHRHQAAPQTHEVIADMIAKGELKLHAGRIVAYRQLGIMDGELGDPIEATQGQEGFRHNPFFRYDAGSTPTAGNGGKLEFASRSGDVDVDADADVDIRPRGSMRQERIRVSHVINCTGPASNVARVRDAFISSLLAKGLIRADRLGLGLDTAEDGAVLDEMGRASRRLYLVGPMLKGRLWESTAVPELREHAARLARTLCGTGADSRQTQGEERRERRSDQTSAS